MRAYARNHNHNEINTIIALDTNELRNFVNGENTEVLTIKEMVALSNEQEEAERKAREEEEREYRDYSNALRELSKEAYHIVSTKGENLTTEDIAIICGILDTYSDMYKDLNGIRPHGYFSALWQEIETIAPKTMACVNQMDEEGTWWDYSAKVQKAYWQKFCEEHNK